MIGVFVELAPVRSKHRRYLPVGYVICENGCWEWVGRRNDAGYGLVKQGARYVRAHRALYEQERGPIPVGLEPDHACRNRACVNPWHLELVTHRENILRGQTVAAAHASKTHCPYGHSFDEVNTYRQRTKHGAQRGCRACHARRERERRAVRRAS